MDNFSTLTIASRSENVVVARLWAAAFGSQVGFSISEIEEIKVAVSEGVSNAMIHGYENQEDKTVALFIVVEENALSIEIKDDGCGIEDVKKAMEPTYSTVSERMGLGFVFMQSFMDEFSVTSSVNKGTTLKMKKTLSL